MENTLLLKAATAHSELGARGCVSYLRIPASRWCSFSYEDSFTASTNTFTADYLALGETAQCSCGNSVTGEFAGTKSLKIITATLYDLGTCRPVSVEVLLCPACKHAKRAIGPDLCAYGIFNWNNGMLFTHTLLNDFTNQYTASETPFSAFCLTVRRRYLDHNPARLFCSEDTFVRVWFAFARLQKLDSGMYCPTCGSTPNVVIADGISLGTHRSKLTTKVQPPTMTDSTSETINTISTY
ncbi:hypothetical protein BDY19DRAFT_899808 [Irpex rosettiformis]|uniref:Uncharacterized protein n=1 Tax=Irpex rosettiformis TaxID=378272 RepID=A0ACB8TP40_9APHY|nr:hypothetical protein BDY19DRAFT_899808 [Irpex rosettiformis]